MASHTLAPFPAELLAAKKQIRERARTYGLDFFPVIYGLAGGMLLSMVAVGFVMVFLASPPVSPIRQP